jgi:hypothetical protein
MTKETPEKIDVKVPGLDDTPDRDIFIVSISFTERVSTRIQVTAKDADHARELAGEVLKTRIDGEVTDVEVFDVYEAAKEQKLFHDKQQQAQEAFMKMLEEEGQLDDEGNLILDAEVEEDKEPTLN